MLDSCWLWKLQGDEQAAATTGGGRRGGQIVGLGWVWFECWRLFPFYPSKHKSRVLVGNWGIGISKGNSDDQRNCLEGKEKGEKKRTESKEREGWGLRSVRSWSGLVLAAWPSPSVWRR